VRPLIAANHLAKKYQELKKEKRFILYFARIISQKREPTSIARTKMVIAVERPDVYHQLLQISMLSQNVRLMERRIKTVVLRKQATQDAKLTVLFIGVIYAETQMITLASTANKEISPQKPKRRLENNRKLMQQWRLKNKD
jgi:hypothetical protein